MAAKGFKAQLKVSSFYGDAVPRPYVLLDKDGNPVEDRVEAPKVNDALIDWACKVPFHQGGALVKPVWDGPQMPKEPRSDFQIFFQERFDDIHAANPTTFASDRKAMLTAASVFWHEQLTGKERAEFRERAVAEKKEVADQIAEAEKANPKFKTFREKLQAYKRSVTGILSAAKVSAGPLWRVQLRKNANYRLLEEQDEACEGGEAVEAGSNKTRKARSKGKKAGRGKKAAPKKRMVESEDDGSSEEDEGEQDASAAAEAVQGMQKLLLATVKKGGKPATATTKSAAHKAATAREGEVVSSGSEEEGDSPQEQQQEHGGRHTRSGTAALASRVGSKGRRAMYADEFELPPSQSATPVKACAGSVGKKGGTAVAVADLPAKSPGKRMRTARHSIAAALAVEESPAKKLRRSACK